MAKTRSMTRNQNHANDDDASSSRTKKLNNGDVAPWSDLTHHVLSLVMMRLGVVDFLAFSGVCKSWRSYALSNKDWFMASRTPMSIFIDYGDNNQDSYLCAKDFEERSYKTLIPHSGDKICYGVACGYLIYYGRDTRDFLLVNPITRHQLHFPDYTGAYDMDFEESRCIFVFSPSTSGWVFVVLEQKVSFYIEGKQRWNHVYSNLPIIDIHFLKGKIYTLHTNCSVGELRLYPNRKLKWTLLETKKSPNLDSLYPLLVSSGENLYMISRSSDSEKVMELDIEEMKWVMPEKTIEEYAFFFSCLECFPHAAIKLQSWTDPWTPYRPYGCKSRQLRFIDEWMWYLPHQCLSVNRLDE